MANLHCKVKREGTRIRKATRILWKSPVLFVFELFFYILVSSSLYVLATSVSAPKKKVWIFQSYVVRDVTYVRSIRYHSF